MHSSVTSLIVVLFAAFITPIIFKRLKLTAIPVVVAEIIAGIFIGHSGLNLVAHGVWIDILSSLGFIFLMFLSGLEIDFSVFSSKGKRKKLASGKIEPNRLLVSSVIFAAILIISFLLSLGLAGLNLVNNSFFMTLVIATISLGVVMPTLKEKGLIKTSIGQIILLITVIADLATMILLSVFVSIYDPKPGGMWLLLILFAAGVLLYGIMRLFRQSTFLKSLSKGTTQIGTRAVFTLILFLVGLSETLGAENILGAFLAGVLVSLLSPNEALVERLDSFGYGFFIPIFFVMIGVDLNVWELLGQPQVILLILLLFAALLLSKFVPVLLLRRWFDWKTVIGTVFLLTSTLSLVVAAAEVGSRIGVISQDMASALILLAVLTCLITPVLFNQLFPMPTRETKKRLHFIGANKLTMPLALEMDHHSYETKIFQRRSDNDSAAASDGAFPILKLDAYDEAALEQADVWSCDVLVIVTGHDNLNDRLSILAKQKGVPRVITRTEDPNRVVRLEEKGIEAFSSMFAVQSVLRAMIESPDLVRMLTASENALYSVKLVSRTYDGMLLRRLPLFGDIIVVRIFRGNESIVPHGDTELKSGDRLMVTGNKNRVRDLRRELG